MNIRTIFFISFVAFSLNSCGYRTGSIPGAAFREIKKIHVPVAENTTFQPALGQIVTDTVIQRLMRDGTLTVSDERYSDATLIIKITDIQRRPQRSTMADQRRTAEYQLRIIADIALTRSSDGVILLKTNGLVGYTDYFVGQDLQEAERQSLGLAAEKLAENIVLQIVEGW